MVDIFFIIFLVLFTGQFLGFVVKKKNITYGNKISLFTIIYKIAISEISDQQKNEKNAIISVAHWWVKSDFPKTPW